MFLYCSYFVFEGIVITIIIINCVIVGCRMSPERAPASALAVSSHSVLRGEERPMYLHRPTSSRSQDVAHLLAATFRELFTRESVPADTVSYLHQARGGADEYHEQYVAALQQVSGGATWIPDLSFNCTIISATCTIFHCY